MLSLKALGSAVPTSKSAAHSFIALYSTVSGLAHTKWGTTGRAAVPLIETEEDERHPLLKLEHSSMSRSQRLRSQTSEEPTPVEVIKHKQAMKKRFPEGWSPPRKLSREAMEGLRSLHAHDPETFSTSVLAEKFRISPEAVRRILRSKWMPTTEQRARLIARDRLSREQWIQERREEEWKKQQESRAGPRPQDKLALT